MNPLSSDDLLQEVKKPIHDYHSKMFRTQNCSMNVLPETTLHTDVFFERIHLPFSLCLP